MFVCEARHRGCVLVCVCVGVCVCVSAGVWLCVCVGVCVALYVRLCVCVCGRRGCTAGVFCVCVMSSRRMR